MEVAAITAEEEKQLRRVFELLCDYHLKKDIEDRINLIRRNFEVKFKPSCVADIWEYKTLSVWNGNLAASTMGDLDRSRIEALYHEMEAIRTNGAKSDKPRISLEDLVCMMRNLKFRISRRDVEEMLWEVDEDLDGALAWTELRLLFTRNVLDRTGLEPSRMFNLVQFLIYDDNANGKVSLDETMHMLFVRYGKRELESKLKEIFGTHSEASPGVEGGGITFAFYLQAVEKVQMQMFHNSAQGKLAAKTLK